LSKITFAQKTITPTWLTIEDGLSQGFVRCLKQDAQGFIWMATKNGLNRFDGKEFEVYTSNKDIPHTINDNSVHDIHDDNGFMLLGTASGLSLYQKKTKRFFEIKIPGFSSSNKPDVFKIVKDKTGKFWITETTTNSLFTLKFSATFLKNSTDKVFNIKDVVIEKVIAVKNIIPFYLLLLEDELFFLAKNEINSDLPYDLKAMNVANKQVRKLDSTPFIGRQIDNVIAVDKIKKSIVFAFSGEKCIYIFKENEWRKIKTNFKVRGLSTLESIDKFLIEAEGKILFFKESDLTFNKLYKTEALSVMNGPKIHNNDVITDTSGVTWIATAGYGVMKIAPRELNIETHFQGKSIYIKPFIYDENNIYLKNPTSGNLFLSKNKKAAEDLKKLIEKHEHSYFTLDKNNQIWGLVWDNYIYSICRVGQNNQIINEVEIGNYKFPYTPQIYYDEVSHRIITIFDRSFTIYDIDKKEAYMSNFENLVNAVERYDVKKTTNGDYWIGTSHGLIQVKVSSLKDVTYKLWNTENGLRNNHVASLLSDINNKNILWLGTKGGGLHRFNIKEETFEYVNSNNGLPNDVIYGVLEDESSNLWMSSNKGIISYNKINKEIRSFTQSDGLQSNEFNTFAYAKMPDGKMVFGGINGLNIFHPDDLKKNTNLPKVWITGLAVNNKSIKVEEKTSLLKEVISNATEIVLPFNQNNISLQFSALEFTAPEKNKFQYYLEGAEEEWVHESTGNKASYLNLSPGDYIFKLKAANGDGVWNQEVKKLTIKILPPWYRSNIAYALYGLLILALLWGFIRIREDKIRKAEQIEKSDLENKLLKVTVEHKKKDLIDFAMLISENQKWGTHLLNNITKIRESRGRAKGKHFDELVEEIKDKMLYEKYKLDIQNKVDLLNNEFYDTLLSQFPNLTKNDLRLCTLIRLDFSVNEIALMQNIAPESVYMSRKRLRKKLNLSPDVDLDVFLK